MDQEETMDFKALRAMFQEKEYLMGQPKPKPVLPEKPKVVSPPQSPTYLPAGARPSLLTSINQALESKSLNAPRVIFKDEKIDSKNPIVQSNLKGKEKSDRKVKEDKDKATTDGKEKLIENSLDHKEKKENGKDKKLPLLGTKKEGTPELVQLPPKTTTQKKKGFSGFKKGTKRNTADQILDTPSVYNSGPAPPIPVAPGNGTYMMEPLYSIPKARAINKTSLPEPSAVVTQISPIPEPPDFSPPPIINPNIPVLRVPTPQSETPAEVENPSLSHSTFTNHIEIVSKPPNVAPVPSPVVVPTRPNIAAPPPPVIVAPTPPNIDAPPPPSIVAPTPPNIAAPPTPAIAAPIRPNSAALPSPPITEAAPPKSSTLAPPLRAAPTLPPTTAPEPLHRLNLSEPPSVAPARSPSPSPPELQVMEDSYLEEVTELEKSPSSVSNCPSTPQMTKAERPISALSLLERAEDMSTGKKTPPGDQRILSALEKARKKTASPLLTPSQSFSVIPPPEEILLKDNPTISVSNSPLIDYNGGNPALPKSAQHNSTDHKEMPPMWEQISKKGSDTVPEATVVPPPQPEKSLPDPKPWHQAPEKPARFSSVNLIEFIPPPPLFEACPVPPEFSETETPEIPEFEESLVSDDYSPEIPVSEWGDENHKDADVSDGQNPTEFYSNGMNDLETEVQSEAACEDDYEESPLPDSIVTVSQDPPPKQEPQEIYHNDVYEETQNTYEFINIPSDKKKGKGNSGKKWGTKGAVKNPYVESTQESVREKIPTSRFGKSEKKPSTEGPDEKELKKKEKQRLEKEKKELKEKLGREKKEQKQREKRENEMKKFNVTGQEEALYEAKVIATSKSRKPNLSVKSGDIISIIRATGCPKGKWLARDSSNTYGYVSVKNMKLDVQEMLKMGNKTPRNSTLIEHEETNRFSNHFGHSAESFSDESEEWTCDEDDHLSPAPETSDCFSSGSHTRTFSMPDMGDKDLPVNHQHSHSDQWDSSQTHGRHDALQKLVTLLHSPKPVTPTPREPEAETSAATEQEEAVSEPENDSTQEVDCDPTAIILPPPDQYADITQ